MPENVRILVVSADPPGVAKIAAGLDYKKIKQTIQSSRYEELVRLEHLPEASAVDLQNELARFNPHVVHFACHGQPEGLIILSVDEKNPVLLETNLLKRILATSDSLMMVVFNSCETRKVGKALRNTVDFVISMNEPISDGAATAFASSLYNGLGLNKSVAGAMAMGRDRIEIEDYYCEVKTPHLQVRNGSDAEIPFFDVVGQTAPTPRSATITLFPPPQMPPDTFHYRVLEVCEGRVQLPSSVILNNPVAFHQDGNQLVAKVLNSRLGLQYKCFVDLPDNAPPDEELQRACADVGWNPLQLEPAKENRRWFLLGEPALTSESPEGLRNNFLPFSP